MLVLHRKLPMNLGQASHGLGSFARMRRVMARFAREFGFLAFISAGEFLVELGVALMFHGMFGEMVGQFEMVVASQMGLGNFFEFSF